MNHSAPRAYHDTSDEPVPVVQGAISNIVNQLIKKALRLNVTKEQTPKWVWKNLGQELHRNAINFSLLTRLARQANCHREVLFQTDKTIPFALVAIVLSPDQTTVTHDHYVDCGPLLVHGNITEVYGYSEQKIKLALLPHRRELKLFEPAEYYSASGDNTHRLKESTGNKPAVAINLYLDPAGNSIKNCYPFYLGTDPQSGIEQWSNQKTEVM